MLEFHYFEDEINKIKVKSPYFHNVLDINDPTVPKCTTSYNFVKFEVQKLSF